MKFIKMVVLLLYFGVALTHAALAAQEEGYNITVPDYIDIEKNLTISNILSYSDVTKAYDAAPWGLDWGKNRAPYKWKVTMAKGDVTIGFERYETISTNRRYSILGICRISYMGYYCLFKWYLLHILYKWLFIYKRHRQSEFHRPYNLDKERKSVSYTHLTLPTIYSV